MPDVAKLKKKAADFELKKQFDKALAVYVEILDSFGPKDEDVDVSLYNRVGDLYLKQGSVGDAVDYYEQAVDRYAESGFHNNAIALCNKILRQSPGRASVYYKLGKISAQKGFKGDAKKNFLEYADRMQSSGQID
jgi:tetratricopeptide (TPR) repeat protein